MNLNGHEFEVVEPPDAEAPAQPPAIRWAFVAFWAIALGFCAACWSLAAAILWVAVKGVAS